MIVTRLKGGLGNQMFQYAIARKLSVMFNTDVVLDTNFFSNQKLRRYGLSNFKLRQRFITDHQRKIFGLLTQHGIERLYYKILIKIYDPVYILENQFNYDVNVFQKARRNTYLDGYWQTEKYFYDIRNILLEDFSFKIQPTNKNLEFLKLIKSVNSVSIHIRRGDYVWNEKTHNFHGTCDIEYYYNAIELIAKKIGNPVLFIFSDDIQWVKQNFKSSFEYHIVDINNGNADHEDLRLMSLCKHNIIANSSFSWWGAWLNTNKSKIVIAPKKWFALNDINYSDVIPENWIKL
jgi:hypothetical protein